MYGGLINKETNRILFVCPIEYLTNYDFTLDAIPQLDITDYLWENEQLVYAPRDKIAGSPMSTIEQHIWKELATAIRKGVNAL